MTGNDKTPVAAGVCHCVAPCAVCACKSITVTRPQQPRPGTAVCALLKRYRQTLDDWQAQTGGDRCSQGLIDCCSAILNEARND